MYDVLIKFFEDNKLINIYDVLFLIYKKGKINFMIIVK